MRFDRPFCPVCRCPAETLVSQVSSRTQISLTGDGTFEPTGRTILEASERALPIDGRYLLTCACGEGWLASRLETDSDAGFCGLPPFCPEPGGADSCVIHLCLETEPPASRRQDLRTLVRQRVEAALAANSGRCPANPPPRYDELFFRGADWLDSL